MTVCDANKRERNWPLNRRQVLSGTAAAAAAAALGGTESLADPTLAAAAGTASTTEIAPGVYVHTGQHALIGPQNAGNISNATIIAGKDAVAVVDTGGSLQNGLALRRAIAAVTDKPVRYVINTHMHPDHVFGNAAFESDTPEYVGHHKLARALAARAESYLRRSRDMIGEATFAGSKIIVPTKPVTGTMELDLGGRTLLLTARPTAHTDNDLTVFDTATRTMIAGDLLFSDHVPTLDGSVLGWLKLIETLKTEPADRAVGGHGAASLPWPQSLEPVQRYWTTIVTQVRAMIKDGKTLSEATATVGRSEHDKWAVFDEHHARNVTAAFAELEWE